MNLDDLSILPPWEWPADAGAAVLETLRDPGADEAESLAAARMASALSLRSDVMARTLLDVVRDPGRPDDVRAAAAISLGPLLEDLEYYYDDDFDLDPRPVTHATERAIRDGLRDVHFDPGAPVLVRRHALEASVRAVEEWHPRAIREAAERGGRDWTLTAVFAMGWLDGFEDEILEALEHDDEDVRLEALTAAGRAGVEGAWAHVRHVLEAPGVPKPLVLAAIEAAPAIGPPEEVASLLIDWSDSDDEEIAAVADEALSLSGLWDDEDFDPDVPFDVLDGDGLPPGIGDGDGPRNRPPA